MDTGLEHGWSDVLLDTYRAFPTVHEPGRVLADLAVVIADGDAILALPNQASSPAYDSRAPVSVLLF